MTQKDDSDLNILALPLNVPETSPAPAPRKPRRKRNSVPREPTHHELEKAGQLRMLD